MASYPADLVPEDTFTNTVQLVGTTARTKVFGGEMLLKRHDTPYPFPASKDG